MLLVIRIGINNPLAKNLVLSKQRIKSNLFGIYYKPFNDIILSTEPIAPRFTVKNGIGLALLNITNSRYLIDGRDKTIFNKCFDIIGRLAR